MFYEKISKQEIDSMENEQGFTPNYTYEDYIIERNEETGEITGEFYINLTIHKTADEVYQEWINSQDNPSEPIPDQNVILLEELENYKHEYILFIEYDGNQQRTLPDDIIKIQGAERILKEGVMPYVDWKYPAEYVRVTDADYFWQMQLAITFATNKTYQVEAIVAQEIKSMTNEQLETYDMKQRFDEVFKSI